MCMFCGNLVSGWKCWWYQKQHRQGILSSLRAIEIETFSPTIRWKIDVQVFTALTLLVSHSLSFAYSLTHPNTKVCMNINTSYTFRIRYSISLAIADCQFYQDFSRTLFEEYGWIVDENEHAHLHPHNEIYEIRIPLFLYYYFYFFFYLDDSLFNVSDITSYQGNINFICLASVTKRKSWNEFVQHCCYASTAW